MAGGKLSARQKMINLMYLIFISMLAMNMGKKVLTSFSKVNESLEHANTTAVTVNKASLASLALSAVDQPEKFTKISTMANKLAVKSDEYYAYLEDLKTKVRGGKTDPETMDGSHDVDMVFFLNGKETPAGKEFQDRMNGYREDALSIVGSDVSPEIIKKIKSRFVTPDEKTKHGKESWLKANYEGFPLIASITNMTKIQNDIKTTENEVYTSVMSGELKSSVTMTNYDAMVVFDKNAYYPGEQLSGKIVLGKNDPTLKAKNVIINGSEVPQSRIKAGQVDLAGSVGGIGEHELKGKFIFSEDGKDVEIKIIGGKYSVIPMPNQAIISADKMNVVYRGVANPISVSMPGVPSNKIRVSAPGLKANGKGYLMNPPAAREVTIKVNATLPNGKAVSSSKKFRVKDIPAPAGTIRGVSGYQKMSKSSLLKSTIGAELKDFVFDLKIGVKSFQVKVPGKPSITVSGTRLDAAAKRAIGRAKRGDNVIIFNIKSYLKGNSSYRLKNTSDISIEITS